MTASTSSPSDGTAQAPTSAGPEAGAEVRSWAWHLMAVSSWLLLVLLPIHLLTTWVLHDPAHQGVAFYVDRWHHAGWRLFDGLLVVLGLLHGGIGLHSVLVRPGQSEVVRTSILVVLVLVLGGIGVLGLSTIFTFNLS